MLQAFNRENTTFTFRDGQSVELKEPTLLQLQSAKAKSKNDDIALAKHLLIDMSNGELSLEFLDALPIGEFKRLSEVVATFAGIDEGD